METSVIIIGAGFSGSLTALNLLSNPPTDRDLQVTLIDPRGSFGPGLAYTVPSDRFKLNVRAKAMGAFPHDPEAFLRWVREREPSISADDFVSRRYYGEYLKELVHEMSRARPASLSLMTGEVVDVLPKINSSGFEVLLADSTRKEADCVVLAVGNILRRAVGTCEVEQILREPYESESYSDISRAHKIFILGSSLTAVDVILECEGRGFSGSYTVVSRNGRFPLPHEDPAALPSANLPMNWEDPGTALNLLRLIRSESRRCGSSQPVFDAMRPRIQEMWSNLSLEQRRAFLRHARPFWEIHRHRIPAEHYATLTKLQASSRLTVLAGKVAQFKTGEASIRRRKSGTETVLFDIGFMCAGPEGNIGSIQHPLMRNLIKHRLIEPGPLRLGIAGNSPERSPGFYVVGPLDKERLWENTAVRELREQAAQVASLIKGSSY